ncbi:putative DNA helicase ino80 [Tulasnella sp. JGI-2019a]|nr:putative DNA helicase ino80 [Tulasnella sp. JGI-2019a]
MSGSTSPNLNTTNHDTNNNGRTRSIPPPLPPQPPTYSRTDSGESERSSQSKNSATTGAWPAAPSYPSSLPPLPAYPPLQSNTDNNLTHNSSRHSSRHLSPGRPSSSAHHRRSPGMPSSSSHIRAPTASPRMPSPGNEHEDDVEMLGLEGEEFGYERRQREVKQQEHYQREDSRNQAPRESHTPSAKRPSSVAMDERDRPQPRPPPTNAVEDWFASALPPSPQRAPASRSTSRTHSHDHDRRHYAHPNDLDYPHHGNRPQHRHVEPSSAFRHRSPVPNEPRLPSYPLEPSPEPPQRPPSEHRRDHRYPADLAPPPHYGSRPSSRPGYSTSAEDEFEVERDLEETLGLSTVPRGGSSSLSKRRRSPSPLPRIRPSPHQPSNIRISAEPPTPSSVIISPHNYLEQLGADESSKNKRRKLDHDRRHEQQYQHGQYDQRSDIDAIEAAEELERVSLRNDAQPPSRHHHQHHQRHHSRHEQQYVHERQDQAVTDAAAAELEREMYSPPTRRASSPRRMPGVEPRKWTVEPNMGSSSSGSAGRRNAPLPSIGPPQQQPRWEMYTPDRPYHERESCHTLTGPREFVEQHQRMYAHSSSHHHSRSSHSNHPHDDERRASWASEEEQEGSRGRTRGGDSRTQFVPYYHGDDDRGGRYSPPPPGHHHQERRRMPSLPWATDPHNNPTIKLPPLPTLSSSSGSSFTTRKKNRGDENGNDNSPPALPPLSELLNAGESTRRPPPPQQRNGGGAVRVKEEPGATRPISSHHRPHQQYDYDYDQYEYDPAHYASSGRYTPPLPANHIANPNLTAGGVVIPSRGHSPPRGGQSRGRPRRSGQQQQQQQHNPSSAATGVAPSSQRELYWEHHEPPLEGQHAEEQSTARRRPPASSAARDTVPPSAAGSKPLPPPIPVVKKPVIPVQRKPPATASTHPVEQHLSGTSQVMADVPRGMKKARGPGKNGNPSETEQERNGNGGHQRAYSTTSVWRLHTDTRPPPQALQWIEDESRKPRPSTAEHHSYEHPSSPPPPEIAGQVFRHHVDDVAREQLKVPPRGGQGSRPSTSHHYHDSITPPTLTDSNLDSRLVSGQAGTSNARLPPPPPPPSVPTSMDIYPADHIHPPAPKSPTPSSKTVLAYRLAAVEEAQIRVWLQIVHDDMPKAQRLQQNGLVAKLATHRRVSQTVAGSKGAMRASRDYDPVRTMRKSDPVRTRAAKIQKGLGEYARHLEREALREVLEKKKKMEVEMFEKAKQEEENREAQRQAKKLEFLLTQTELYSHFVGNKGRAGEDENEGDDDAMVEDDTNELGDDPTKLDFENTDSATLRRLASKKAQKAAARTKKYHAKFQVATGDSGIDGHAANGISLAPTGPVVTVEDVEKEVADLVATRMNNQVAKQPLVDLDSDELNFQHPSSMNDKLDVAQPKMLQAELKDYQLQGLNWLATLYDQGINGILADEMGLGKTVQSISLLAHLAETHNIWGPFLIVAPASTLHNWHQELTRFLPALKAIPYWGNPTDRRTLRKYWANNRHAVWTKESDCHVIVTSYTLMINDLKYFQAINWQFLILDEAQAIKNSSSSRWNALLDLNTRNRLLLTGTPIQNSMQELWALLHFIMPSLFDSHDEFSEWFSKDVEGGDQSKRQGLNEHQLRRLHLILKPFMLRRVKRMVQTHLLDKIEIDVFCEMSPRQRNLYRAMRANISMADLLNKATHLGDASSAKHLMNLVMQFRKVCNHPELFLRTDVLAPFSFSVFARTGSIMREGNFVICPDSARNPIELVIPKVLYIDGGLLSVPGDNNARKGFDTHYLHNLMNIWSTDWLERSLNESRSAFSFLPMLQITPSEAHALHIKPTMRSLLAASAAERHLWEDGPFLCDSDFSASSAAPPFLLNPHRINVYMDQAHTLPALSDIGRSFWVSSYLSRSHIHCYVAPAEAPPISMYCAERTFVETQERITSSPVDSLALYGLPQNELDSPVSYDLVSSALPGLPSSRGLFGASPTDQLPVSPMHFPDAERLIFDSAKLARLDALLTELKAGGHRALIYFQMVKMMDILEEYLVFRQYKYLRLDGTSSIEDRRDMVMDWQTRPDIFVFMLSTHAGGLGINLTAADTVIFYENDWNPSNDSQAMDRAHRIGQTKQVMVYRLITKGTIDERIVQLARVKKEVSDVVVGNKDFREIARPTEIVSLLLDDEELKKLDQQALDAGAAKNGYSSRSSAAVTGWELEGDDFFGQPRQNVDEEELEAEAEATSAPIAMKGKRKSGPRASGVGRPRGRPRKYPSAEPA